MYRDVINKTSISAQNLSKIIFATCALVTLAAPANAQEKMKSGLWEMSIKSDAVKSVPNIPPAQLEALKKNGINMPEMRDGAIIQKVCISKEMSERSLKSPPEHSPGNCKTKDVNRSGTSYSMEMVCNSAMLQGTATIKGKMTGDTIQSTYDFKGTANNHPSNQHIETSGKWLGADCGTIKPIPVMVPPEKK